MFHSSRQPVFSWLSRLDSEWKLNSTSYNFHPFLHVSATTSTTFLIGSRSTNMTQYEFIAHFYMAKQIVPTNKRIVVMSWITLLCMQMPHASFFFSVLLLL